MKCPNCSAVLVMTTRSDVEIDYCPECRGIWLDRGELDKIMDRMKVALKEEETDRRPVRYEGEADRRPVRYEGEADRRPVRYETDADRLPVRSEADADRRPVRYETDDDRRPVRYDDDDDQTARKTKKRSKFGEIFDIFG